MKKLKIEIKEIPCLSICHPNAPKIVQTDASELGYGGILSQIINNKETIIRYYSGVWKTTAQKNYPTIKKRNIIYCIVHF